MDLEQLEVEEGEGYLYPLTNCSHCYARRRQIIRPEEGELSAPPPRIIWP
jgi:hypothetical protein